VTSKSKNHIKKGLVLAALAAVVLTTYWPVLNTKALMLDDDQYLVNNYLVRNPGWGSAKRFFTEVFRPSTVRGYYHPLAMVSLMADVAIGAGTDNLKPFHITSLALHLFNTLLVVWLFYLLFGQFWPAVIAGLFFGVHPVTIESVAWVAERKTPLAAFFGLWCLIFYLLYVRRDRWWQYTVCVVMFVLSALAKPVLVLMPVLLLLLDYWPLARLSKKTVSEKIPLFVICIISAVVTYISQATTASVRLPNQAGAANALLTLCHNIIFYLRSFFWPVNLSWYYPYPKPFDLTDPMLLAGVIGTAVLIVVLIISLRRTKVWAVGWLFFFFAIAPAIGLIGIHPMIAADRHIYFPMIGFLMVIGWLWGRLWQSRDKLLKQRRVILIVIAIAVSATQMKLTRRYLSCWSDSESIYKYMLESAPNEVILHNNLANILSDNGKTEEAIKHFKKSLELKSDSAEVYNNLGDAMCNIGRIDEGIEYYKKAISLNPRLAAAHYNLAVSLAEYGKTDEAINEYKKALEIRPDNLDTLSNLAYLLAEHGKTDEAIAYYQKALAIEPNHVITHGRLGLALAALGRTGEAIEHFRIVLKARPYDFEMHCNLGVLLQRQGDIEQAAIQYKKALQIKPGYKKAVELLKNLSGKN